MSEMSKMVFVAFMQHCIQGTDFMSEIPKIYKHVFAHNFLNIQWIFNPEKVLKSWDIGLSNHTIKYCVY